MIKRKPSIEADPSPAFELLDRFGSPLESLANLVFLASAEAEHPEKVRFYMQMADEQMQLIRQIALEVSRGKRPSR